MMKEHVNENMRQAILRDEFNYYRTNKSVMVELYEECLKFYKFVDGDGGGGDRESAGQSADFTLSLADVAGSSVGRTDNKNDTSSYLTIYAYVKSDAKKRHSKRKRKCVELEFKRLGNYNDNTNHICSWHLRLYELLKFKHIPQTQSQPEQQTSNDDVPKPGTRIVKPLLVFVNPKSGAGKAKNIFFERILPVWAEANFPDTTLITKYSNFAREYVRNIKIDDYAGIAVVSGDGLVYEVINGLMDRDDWQQAIKMPIAQIPGGSANALACCTAYLTDEIYKGVSLESFATQTAFNITKSKSTPLDLVRYQISNGDIIHSFLALEWAIVADVDLESEKYRFLGGMRFLVGAIKRILSMRIYRGRVSFLPADECKNYRPKDDSIKVIRNDNKTSASSSTGESDSRQPTTRDNKFKYLNPLGEPVPDDWLTIEENFVLLVVIYLPLLSPDFLGAPDSTFNDGNMHLFFIKQGITQFQLLRLFQDTETGDHLKSDLVEYVKCKAFRLEPLRFDNSQASTCNANYQNEGTIMIDGEKVPYGGLQAEIMPSVANILANVKNTN